MGVQYGFAALDMGSARNHTAHTHEGNGIHQPNDPSRFTGRETPPLVRPEQTAAIIIIDSFHNDCEIHCVD